MNNKCLQCHGLHCTVLHLSLPPTSWDGYASLPIVCRCGIWEGSMRGVSSGTSRHTSSGYRTDHSSGSGTPGLRVRNSPSPSTYSGKGLGCHPCWSLSSLMPTFVPAVEEMQILGSPGLPSRVPPRHCGGASCGTQECFLLHPGVGEAPRTAGVGGDACGCFPGKARREEGREGEGPAAGHCCF